MGLDSFQGVTSFSNKFKVNLNYILPHSFMADAELQYPNLADLHYHWLHPIFL